MLSEKNRLKKKTDFEKVFKKGKAYKEDFLFLKFIKNDLEDSRFGFVVSNKVSKKAIVRNKIRRRLKALTKTKLSIIEKGIDSVIIVRPGLEINDFWELEEKINKLFKKAGIIK
ncbi:MAG: ribonuclease P protein component [Candidatus Nealsonbacteria bacterium]